MKTVIRKSTVKKTKNEVLDFIKDDENWGDGDEQWRVHLSSKSLEGSDSLGETDMEHKIITISTTIAISHLFSILTHEVLHVLLPEGRERNHDRIYALTAAIKDDLSPIEKSIMMRRIGMSGVVDE